MNHSKAKQWILRLLMLFTALFIMQLPVQAASGTVKLAKKSMQLQIVVKNGKTYRQSSKIQLKRAKSVKKMKVTYKSSNSKVVKVSSKGKVTAIRPGTATITVKVKYKHHLRHKWHKKVLKEKIVVKKTIIRKKVPVKKPTPAKPTPAKPTPPKTDPNKDKPKDPPKQEEPKKEESTEDKPKFQFKHNPELQPKAMADIVKNPNAIYGYSPSTTGSIKQYAIFDWSDAALVAKNRQSRIDYHKSIASMYTMLLQMKSQGKSMEEMARTISAERNRIRVASYDNDPAGLAALKERNLEQYGNENGPTPEYLYAQYGSWEMVLQKAFSMNIGMDVCLGLYDDYYQVYIDLGLIKDNNASSQAIAMSEEDLFYQIYRICKGHRSID